LTLFADGVAVTVAVKVPVCAAGNGRDDQELVAVKQDCAVAVPQFRRTPAAIRNVKNRNARSHELNFHVFIHLPLENYENLPSRITDKINRASSI